MAGSITLFQCCRIRFRYHGQRGWSSFHWLVGQKQHRRSVFQVFHTFGVGRSYLGYCREGEHVKSNPFVAQLQIDLPLLVTMSAKVVTPRCSRHRCACTSSVGLIPGRVESCSIMNTSPWHWGRRQGSWSNRICAPMDSINSQVAVK